MGAGDEAQRLTAELEAALLRELRGALVTEVATTKKGIDTERRALVELCALGVYKSSIRIGILCSRGS